MLNIRITMGRDCEISIEESIKVLTVIARQYNTSQVQDAITTAILCMRKVQEQEA